MSRIQPLPGSTRFTLVDLAELGRTTFFRRLLISLSDLRHRFHDLPDDKDQEIICFCKISLRGYEAQLLLEANGWTNVKVMEGGIMAWPFGREK